MGITKLGKFPLFTTRQILTTGKNLAFGAAGKTRGLAGHAYNAATATGRGAASAANAVGSTIAKHPVAGMTLAGGSVLAAATVPNRMHRNMAHADFRQNATYVKPLTKRVRLVDNSDAAKKNVALYNRLY